MVVDDNSSAEDEWVCGYSYDHTVREVIDGHWTCEECGAEGWDDDSSNGDGEED